MTKVTEYEVKVRQFLTKPSTDSRYKDKKPVPMRIMYGYITQETANGVYMVLRGKAKPASICCHCGRTLTHPVSLLYGIGPECGGHYHDSPMPKEALDAWFESIKAKMADIVWEGWLPKFHIEMEATGEEIEPFGEETKKEEKPEEKPEAKPVTEVKKEAKPEPKIDKELVESLVEELVSLF